MAIEPKGSQQAVDRREHELEREARRVIPVDPFGGVITDGNFTIKVETSGDDTYVGMAQIGTLTSVSEWQIRKVTTSGTLTSVLWAEGTDAFTNEWDERATYDYS